MTMKTVLQSEQNECGLACLAMIASHFGDYSDLSTLRNRFSISLKGVTLIQLMRHAAALNMSARPLRLDVAEISMLRLPCILHWDMNHFVVLKRVKRRLNGDFIFLIVDPAVGERRITIAEVSQHFTGVALELTPTAYFEKKPITLPLKISDIVGKIHGLRGAISIVISLAFVLEIFTIVTPLFNQFVIDEVIVSGDSDLLTVLVFGFGILLVSQTAIGLARSWILMRWSVSIGFQWTSRIFSHMIKLPIDFFEKRHLGDLLSRFGSINSIQNTLTSLFVTSLLDGLMTILSLGMMISYSWKLSSIVVVTVILYALLRWVFYFPGREAARERLILSAKENSHFIETLRAIVPLKLYGREVERRSRWQNLKQDVINRDVKTQKIGILFQTANSAISGSQSLMLFFFGAKLVMNNELTIGMLMSFSSYAGTFTVRIFSLIDLLVNLRMLGMHTERLADIVLEKPEEESLIETNLDRISGTIELRNIKFRYADGEPWILNDLSLKIPAGQSIALIGSSGCGKTTLCKVMLGLLIPTEGEVFIDDIPIKQLGLSTYRQLVGTVMQDDLLLSGSLQDNISFFDGKVEIWQVEKCAQFAAIHEEILSMPMGYQTLIGEMGNGLSGGQKQRILLARALYKSPKILCLDEATSHLDIDNEERVNKAISSLQLTRIMVAHRPETIRAADRVVKIFEGKAFELSQYDFKLATKINEDMITTEL